MTERREEKDHDLLDDERHREGDENLRLVRKGIGMPKQKSFDCEREDRDEGRAEQQSPPETSGPEHDGIGDIGGREIEGAVSEVYETHQPENQREADRQKKIDHADADTVQNLKQEKLGRHRLVYLRIRARPPSGSRFSP